MLNYCYHFRKYYRIIVYFQYHRWLFMFLLFAIYTYITLVPCAIIHFNVLWWAIAAYSSFMLDKWPVGYLFSHLFSFKQPNRCYRLRQKKITKISACLFFMPPNKKKSQKKFRCPCRDIFFFQILLFHCISHFFFFFCFLSPSCCCSSFCDFM